MSGGNVVSGGNAFDCEVCAAGPPPPRFLLPPPPRPPALQASNPAAAFRVGRMAPGDPDGDPGCSEAALADMEVCAATPVSDVEYHSSPAIPSMAVIAVCSILLVAMLLVASALVWKHKRKMQSFLLCKSTPTSHCDGSTANAVIYEDLTNIRPRALPPHLHPGHTAPSIEMLDVKGGEYPTYPSVFICPPPRTDPYTSQDLYNPVYEELSNGSNHGDSDGDSERMRTQEPLSEDEFAEDELSLAGDNANSTTTNGGRAAAANGRRPPSGDSSLHGSTGNDLSRDLDSSDADDQRGFLANRSHMMSLPPAARVSEPVNSHRPRQSASTEHRRGRSLDRRRGRKQLQAQQQLFIQQQKQLPRDCSEFHEGLLLDALMQLCPGERPARAPSQPALGGPPPSRGPIPSVAHRLPYVMPTVQGHSHNHTNHPYEALNHRFHPGVNPYESVPVLGHLHHQYHHATQSRTPNNQNDMLTFRPFGKSVYHDSDSGYSNNTSGGRGSASGSRGRKESSASGNQRPLSTEDAVVS